MRRFFAFVVLLACSLPVGLSIAGCGHNPNNYCVKNGHAYGPTTNQVAYVTLGPETVGLSLTWGQTGSLGAPQAYNCNGSSESVGSYTYGSSNLLLADVSPGGQVCAGTWNRNSPGGVPNFTICTPPSGSQLSSFSGCTTGTCGTVQLTAVGGGVTSNPVDVYVHPPITSITIPTQTACVSQNQTLPTSLLAETTVNGPGGMTLCSPTTTACTSPNANIGTIDYTAVTGNVVTIENTTQPSNANPVTGNTSSNPNPNGIATANLPGSTVVFATTSNVTSASGYFSTCPPKNIQLSINGSNSATVTPSSPQTAVAVVTDSAGKPINGLPLSYVSTEPQNLGVSSTGLITNTYPSHATVSAICAPPGCNPAPVNLIGNLGNGMPVTGNNVTVNATGRSSNQIWMASSQSPYFSYVDLTTGLQGSPVRLPYTPNSMVMDETGDTLYFGSYHELMVYGAQNNSLTKEVPGVPGVVLAVAPSNNQVVINDQLRQVIYLYNTTAGTYTSVSGIADHAQYSPDGTTVYISGVDPATGQNTLFVNNASTGWSTYPLNNQPAFSCALEAAGTAAIPAYNPSFDPFCGQAATLTVPNVGTFLTGSSTAIRSFCPNAASATATPTYYPAAGDVGVTTTQLNATADGLHVLGADPSTFSDILLGAASGPATGVPAGACPAFIGPPLTLTTNALTATLPVTASEIDQVVSSPDSSLAFVTYNGNTGTGTGVLPYYQPLDSGALGTLSTLHLSGTAQAPVAGIFSPDGTIFFTSTSGDNLVHIINTTTLTDTQTFDPKLTNGSGVAVPAQFLAVRSRSTT
ncbi:MAG TPA: hypothetical protein VHX37_17590 [Acidobacteriaceae bacterium]|jgi:hypothetical protein|nr:hypothetical protein [Acidobacteriaceae bacterium]